MVERECYVCGITFAAGKGQENLRHCSDACIAEGHRRSYLRALANARERRKLKIKTKVCVICGKTYMPASFNRPNQLCCSPECARRRRWNKEHDPEVVVRRRAASLRNARNRRIRLGLPVVGFPKVCKECGKTFIQKRNRQIYCSPECVVEMKRTYDRKKDLEFKINRPPPALRKCLECGCDIEVKTHMSRTRLCSPACRRARYTRIQRKDKANREVSLMFQTMMFNPPPMQEAKED